MSPIGVGIGGKEPMEVVPREEWASRIKENEASDEKFWSSPLIQAKLFVELPFWLMAPEASYELTFEGSQTTATLHNSFCEIVGSAVFLDSRANLLFMGPRDRAAESEAVAKEQCPVLRPAKTVVEFTVDCIHAAFIDAESEEIRHLNRASHYFSTLALAHIPYLNELIAAYRSASRDPFAFEVSGWDVSLWWFQHQESLVRTEIMPYWNKDEYPELRSFSSGEGRPYFATDSESIRSRLEKPISPGRLEMLDAVSLMYRGRYSDAIRSAVTAIEIAVEAELRLLYKKSGCSDDECTQRLESSRDSFHERINEFEQLSQRRFPGPYLSMIPYLHGIRLREELERTRRLRHKIVHEGLRVNSRGTTLRAIETTTWLLDWISDDRDNLQADQSNYEMFTSMRGQQFFPFDYTDKGIQVRDNRPVRTEDVPTVDEIYDRLMEEILNPKVSDMDLFVRMALADLNLICDEARPESANDIFIRERFSIDEKECRILVFCIELDQVPKKETVESAIRRVAHTASQTNQEWHGVFVVHHQKHLPVDRRIIEEAFAPELGAIATQNGITLLTALELRHLVYGVKDECWSVENVRTYLRISGHLGIMPPGFKRVGLVKRHFDRHNILVVDLSAGCELEIGDTICVRTAYRYRTETIRSMEINKHSKRKSVGPCLVGVAAFQERGELKSGQPVFVRARTYEI